MAENKGLGLPQTNGVFMLQGIVTGTEKDGFYKEMLTQTTKKPFRMVNFGVQTDQDSTVYVTLSGGEKPEVYFSKSEVVDGKRKTEIEKVAWANRLNFNKEGFRLIGVNVGVKKKLDEKGNQVNDKKILTEYDACKEIYDNLKDGLSVFVRGRIDYSHYDANGATRRSVKFVPTQVSLCKDVVFDVEGFTPTALFTQTIVFTGIEPDPNDKNRFIVSAKIVGFNSVEEAEFVIRNRDLALVFRKNLKPYNAITINGNISVVKSAEEISSQNDWWGEQNRMNRVVAPTIRELVITGADPLSIDRETYSEAAIEEALAKIKANKKAENEFNGEDWGTTSNTATNDDLDSPWD